MPYRKISVIKRNTSGTIRTQLGNVDAVILPGGFSYGDYLRCGAIARFSPVMKAVKKFAADGGLVMGICNGFQILCRKRTAARRAAAKRRSEVHLQARRDLRRNHRTRHLHTRRKVGQISEGPHRSRRRKLLCRRSHARRTRSRGSHCFPVRHALQRLNPEHCRNSEPRAQCARNDAPPGTRSRSADGLHRRARDFQVRW